MTIDLIAFCTGVVLLLIAIIGGGIKIKEIEVPLLSKGGALHLHFLVFSYYHGHPSQRYSFLKKQKSKI